MKTKSFVSMGTCFLGLTLSALLPVQGAVDLNPTADAFVTTGPANDLTMNNYGGGGALALSAGLAKGEFQSVLRFDTSSAKTLFDGLYGVGSWSVQSVTLQLTAGSPNNAIFNANAAGSFGVSWMENDSWTEGSGTPSAPGVSGITYATLQSTFINPGQDEPVGAFNYNGSSSGATVYTLNTPSGLTADLLAGNLVSLRLSAADSMVSYFFNSRSIGTTTSRPVLSISAVPEPTAVVLLALGGLGLLWVTLGSSHRSPKA